MLRLISMGYAASTWSSYQTAWWSYRTFYAHYNKPATLPIPVESLAEYINYLSMWRKLQIKTIRGYLSALKVLHFLNWYTKKEVKAVFSHFVVTTSLNGIEHINHMSEKDSNPRKVFSYPALKLLGHGLLEQGFGDFDLQVIWTTCVLAFWGSFRMSELIASGHKDYQKCNALTWGKIFKSEGNQITVSIKFPKSMTQGTSNAVDVYKCLETIYCPIMQLSKLFQMAKNLKVVEPTSFVFQLESGKPLTMPQLNRIIESVMSKFFDGNTKFSCHSFRAGLPAWMAAQPHMFDEQEIKVIGRWSSNAFLHYTRLSGIAREVAIHKVLDNMPNR